MPTKKTATKTVGKRLVERSPSQMKFILLALAGVLVSFGVAYALGTKSSGQINVASTIEQNQQREAEENPDAPPPQKLRDTRATIPNGGLVPAAVQPDRKKKEEPAAPAADTGTTTEDVATSTDETTEEGEEGEESDGETEGEVTDEDTGSSEEAA